MLDNYRYRGRHHHRQGRHHLRWNYLKLAAPVVLAVAIAAAAVTPALLLVVDDSSPPPVAAELAEPRGPDVPPMVDITTTPASSRPPPPAGPVLVSCDDYHSGPAAQVALDTDPSLADGLDTDRDGLACERRWPPPAPPTPPATPSAPEPDTGRCPTELDGTRPHVARAGHHLAARFDVPLGSVGGRAPRTGPSDHPDGLALDFPTSRDTGDQLADYALTHRDVLAVKYVIWRQRINHGAGWEPMPDRGSVTANHFDHVHVSFEVAPGPGLPC